MAVERIDKGPRMSQVAIVGNLVFTAGQVADRTTGGDVGAQTREILGIVDNLLARAGTDKSRLISVTIYLAAIGDFDAMNAVYDAWVDKANPPVRACVEARLAGSEFRVEIVAIAER